VKLKLKYKQRPLSWVSRLLQPSSLLRRLSWLSSSVIVMVEEDNVVVAVMVRCHKPRQSRRRWRRVPDPDLRPVAGARGGPPDPAGWRVLDLHMRYVRCGGVGVTETVVVLVKEVVVVVVPCGGDRARSHLTCSLIWLMMVVLDVHTKSTMAAMLTRLSESLRRGEVGGSSWIFVGY
jgi:hypothetical protein